MEVVGFVELLAGIEGLSVLHCPVEDVGADAFEGEGGFLAGNILLYENTEPIVGVVD